MCNFTNSTQNRITSEMNINVVMMPKAILSSIFFVKYVEVDEGIINEIHKGDDDAPQGKFPDGGNVQLRVREREQHPESEEKNDWSRQQYVAIAQKKIELFMRQLPETHNQIKKDVHERTDEKRIEIELRRSFHRRQVQQCKRRIQRNQHPTRIAVPR